MSVLAWLRRPCRPASPPDASSSDSLDLPAARAQTQPTLPCGGGAHDLESLFEPRHGGAAFERDAQALDEGAGHLSAVRAFRWLPLLLLLLLPEIALAQQVRVVPSILQVNEGEVVSITVELSSRPASTATFSFGGIDGVSTAEPTSLTFTTTDWDEPQTVRLTFLEDDDAVDIPFLRVGGYLEIAGVRRFLRSILLMSITDNDKNAPALRFDPQSVAVGEGGSGTYRVRLSSQPTDAVTVAITGQSGTDLMLDNTSLTFTTGDWETDQTVTVTAGQDDDQDDDVVTLSHAASGGGYTNVRGNVLVTVTDDDGDKPTVSIGGVPAKINSSTPLSVTFTFSEAVTGFATEDVSVSGGMKGAFSGSGTTYTLAVTPAGSADVVVTVAADTATNGGGKTGPVSAVSATAKWDATAPTVSITGVPAKITSRTPFTAMFTFSEDVTGFATGDVTVTGGGKGTLTAVSATTYRLAVTPAGSADVVVTVAADAATDGVNTGPVSAVTATATWDAPGLRFVPQSLAVGEGDSGTYRVRLFKQPTDTVTVAITGQSGTDLTLDNTSLMFTRMNWETDQTVTVMAGQDDDGDEDVVRLMHTASGGDYTDVIGVVVVTVTDDDDDTVGIVLTPASSLGVDEGDDKTYTVKLATQPSATVTVAISGHAGTDLTLDTTSLTFNPSGAEDLWSTAQTVTVSAGEDDDAANDTATLLHTASGGDYAGQTASLAVTTTDDDTVGIVLTPASSLGVAEGADATYTVKLATQPSATVTVAITGHAGTDLTLDTTSLTFNPSGAEDLWSTAQTVTVSAGEDDDVSSDTATLLHTASGGDYAGQTASLAVTTTDDDKPTVAIGDVPSRINSRTAFTATFTWSEDVTGFVTGDVAVSGGMKGAFTATNAKTYTLAVTPNGSADVVVTVAADAATVGGGNTGPAAAVTATATWDAAAPTVTITGVPAKINSRTGLTATFTWSEAVTGFAIGDVTVTGGAAGAFTAVSATTYRLAVTPADESNVTVAVTADAATDGVNTGPAAAVSATATWDAAAPTVAIGGVPARINSTAALSVTFTWSEDVTEFATGDVAVSGGMKGAFAGSGREYTLAVTPTNGSNVTVEVAADAATDGLNTGPASAVSATATWDTVGIVLTPASSLGVAEGADTTYTVKLATQPSATVTVAITGHAGTDLTLDTTSLTFNPSGAEDLWSTAQTVTVSAGEDDDAANDTATLLHTASGGDYASKTASLTVTTTDDDKPTVAIGDVPSRINSRTAFTATFTWSEDVTGFATGDVAVSGGMKGAFTATNAKTYTLAVTPNGSADVVVTVAADAATVGGGNTGPAAAVTATATWDAAAPTVTITGVPAKINSRTGLTATFTWSEAVTGFAIGDVTVTGGAAGAFTAVSATTYRLAVTPADESNVTVAVTADAATDGVNTGPVSAVSATATWDAAAPTVAIGGVPARINSTAALSVTFTWSEDVTGFATGDVAVSGGAAGAFAGSGREYTLAVTPNGSADVVVTVAANAATDGLNTGPVSAVTATATWDTVGIVLTPASSLGVAEGADETYTVKLATQPSATVTVAITGHAGTDLTLDTTSLTFNPSGAEDLWSTAQTVTVSAGEDDDASSDTATLLHTASGGDYASKTASLTVTTTDDDKPTVAIGDVPSRINSRTAFTATFTWSEDVTGFATGDVAVSGGMKGAFTATNAKTYTLAVTPNGSADVVVTVAADAATVGGGNTGPAAAVSATATWDAAAPTVTITGVPAKINSRTGLTATFTWSEAVTGFAIGDVTVTGGAAGAFTAVSATTYRLAVTPADESNVTVAVTADAATDGVNTGPAAAVSATATWDAAAPTVAIGGVPARINSTAALSVTFTWSEDVTEFATGDVAVSGGMKGAFTATNAKTYTLAVTPNGSADVVVTVAADAATDGLNTGPVSAVTATATWDTVGIVLTPASSLGVDEGADATYTVKLATQPSATVTVAISGHAGTDLTLDTTSLTFNPSGAEDLWSTAQTVTVSAGEDDDASSDTATLLHTASGGDYASKTASLTVTTTDDDTVGIVLTPASSLGVDEGDDETYTVKLATQPSATVTVAISGHAGTDLTLDTTSLTFNPSGAEDLWSTAQTVTVSAGEDDDASSDTATLLHTASGGDYASKTASLTVTTTDDDPVGIVLTPASSLGVDEGDDKTYTVKLATQPSATVTVAITGHAGTDLTLDTTSLTFNPSGAEDLWSTAQTVTVSAGEDDDAANDTATLLHTASGGDYASKTASLTVTTTDDDPVGIVLTPASSLGVAEGDDKTYTVKLATQPSATVTVAITGHAGTDLTLDTTSLTFNPSGAEDLWSTAQTVTVSAGEDDDASSDTATLLHTASGGDYASKTASLTVTTTDDDTVGIVLTPASSLGVDEGADATYTVKLATQPSATVTVAITGHAGTDLTLDTTSLTFNPSGAEDLWSTAQTVTVSAGEDDDASSDTATLLHTASGGDYASKTASLTVTTTDDDKPTVAIGDVPSRINSRTAFTATFTWSEDVTGFATGDVAVSGGMKGAFTATNAKTYTLAVTPNGSADVVVTVAADAATVGGGNTGPAAAVTATATWDAAAPTVTITGVPAKINSRTGLTATFTWSEAVTGFAIGDVTVTGGAAGAFTAVSATTYRLAVTPADESNVTVAVTADAATDGVNTGPVSAVSATATWDAAAPTVAIGGVPARINSTAALSVTFTWSEDVTEFATGDVAVSGGMKGAFTATNAKTYTLAVTPNGSADVVVTVAADAATDGLNTGPASAVTATATWDTVGIVLTPASSLGVAEGADTTYTVKLATQPSATVTVAITGHAGTDLTLDTTSLTFNPSGAEDLWSTAQTVTVSAGEDDDAANDTATLLHTASGGDYASKTASLTVTTTDDDTVGIVLTPASSLGVAEGADATYTVKLATQPSATVTVAITGHAGTDLTLDTTSLTFNPSGAEDLWSTAQTVTVSAGEDDDASSDTATLLHTASGGDYASKTASLTVTTTDDDKPTVAIGDVPSRINSRTAFTATFTWSEDVTGFATGDVAVSGGMKGAFTATNAKTYTLAVTPNGSADVVVTVAADAATVGGGNTGPAAAVSATATWDAAAPTVTITGVPAKINSRTGLTATFTWSEAVTGFAIGDVTVTGGAAGAFTAVSATTYRLAVTPADESNVTVAVTADAATDGVNTGPAAAVSATATWDAAAPTVAIGGVPARINSTAALSVTFTWSEDVTEFATGDVAVSGGMKGAFTATNAKTYTLAVTPNGSADVVVTVAADAATDGLNTGPASAVTATATWDTVGIVLTPASSLGVDEGDDKTYTVKLATQPSATVTVAITGHAGTDLTLDTTSLTFNPSGAEDLWSTAQTVTVSAGEDDDAANDTATLLHTASGGDYASKTASLTVTTTDDDKPTVAIGDVPSRINSRTAFTATFTWSEDVTGFATGDVAVSGGMKGAFTATNAKTYTLAVTPNGSADVVVTVAADAATVGGGNTGPAAAVSATATWDAAAPTVTITGVPAKINSRTGLTATFTWSEAVTGFAIGDVTVTGGAAGAFTAVSATTYRLAVTPADESNVTVAVTADAATDGVNTGPAAAVSATATWDAAAPTVAIGGVPARINSTAALSVTFTWSEDVTGFATGDVAVSGGMKGAFTATNAKTYTLAVTPNGSADVVVTVAADAATDGLNTGPASAVTATATWDTVGIVLTPASSLGVAEGADATYTVKLATQPSATVTVAITGHAGTDLTLDTTSLTFNPSGAEDLWSTAQTVTVSAGEDDDASSDTATLLHTASGGDYASKTASLTVTTTDDDKPTVAIGDVPSRINSRTAFTATFTWSEDVTGFATGDVAVSGGMKGAFTATNAKTYTLAVTPNGSADVVVTVAADAATVGGGNTGPAAAVSATATWDAAAPTVTITGVPAKINSRTGLTATFTWSEAVTGFAIGDVTVTGGAAGAFTAVSATTYRLAVTPADESNVTVAVTADAATDGVNTGPAAAVSATATWDAAAPTVAIGGVPARINSTAALSVTFTWSEDVTGFATGDVAVSGGAAGAFAGSGREYTLAVTPNGSADVVVTVAADAATDGLNTGPVSAVTATATWDTVGIVLTPASSLGVAEGADATYTVKLATQPSATVTVAITGHAGTDLTLDTTSLTFNPSGAEDLWSTAQTVTVSAGEDDDASSDTATLLHTASGGDYASKTASLTVTTTDDDKPTVAIGDVPSRINSRTAFTATFTWSEDVTGFATGDVAVSGGMKGAFTATNAKTYTLAVTPNGSADVVVTVAADAATVGGGNTGPAAAVSATATWDAAAPTVTITGVPAKINSRTGLTATFTWSEAVTGFAIGDVTVTGGAAGAFTAVSATTYRLAVTPADESNVTVAVTADAATDGVNTGPAAAVSATATWDAAAPTVAIGGVPARINSTAALSVTFTWSEDVTEFATGDVAVSGGMKGAFTATNAKTYTLAVTPNGSADVVVTVAADAATDGLNTGPASAVSATATWDTVGIVLTPASSLGVAEGADETYTVKLATQPSATVTVAITGHAGTDLTLDTTSLTFNPSGAEDLWSTAQTVTVSAGEDDDASSDTATLLHTASGGDYASKTASLTVTTTDDDKPTVAIGDVPSRINSRTAFTATFTWSEDVTGFATGDVAVSGGMKGAFTATNAKTYTLAVTPNGSADVVVTVAADAATVGGGNTGPAAAVSATATWDAAAPTVTITGVPAKINSRTGLTATFTWSEAVTGFAIGDVTVTGGAAGAFTAVSATTYRLAVTPADESNVTVAVTADAATDGVNTGPAAVVSATATWDAAAPTVAIGGVPARINSTAALSVTFTWSEDVTGFATGDVAVSGGMKGAFAGSGREYTLAVTPTNGSNVTVEVAANTATDGLNTGPVSAVTATATWDTVGIVLTPASSLGVAEGADATYTVKLATQPSATVTVAITGHAGTDLTLDTTSLTFNPSGAEDLWSTAQTVTVSAGEDDDASSDTATLLHTASGGDYASKTASLTVTTTDDDKPTVAIGDVPSRINSRTAFTATFTWSEDVTGFATGDVAVSGGMKGAFTATNAKTYTLAVTPNGSADVVVTVAADAATVGGGNTGPAAAVSATATWDAAAPTVTITGVPAKINSRTGLTATFTWSEAVTGFAIGDVTVTGGAAGAFTAVSATTYRLAVTPADESNVTVAVTADAATDGVNTGPAAAVSATATWDAAAPTVAIGGVPARINSTAALSVTFTWSEDVTEFATGDVAVSGGMKGTFTATNAKTYTLAVTPNGSADVVVTVAADAATDGLNTGPASAVSATATWDTVGIVLTPASSLGVAEGADKTYTVKLATQPSATVTVAITGHAGTDLTLDTTSLTFNPSGAEDLWSTAQTVTVSAGEDDDASSDTATLLHTASGGDYASKTASLTVTTTDDDPVGIVLTPASSLGVDEGDDKTYTVKLATQPSATVTVAITGHAGTDLTLDTTSLTFNPSGAEDLWSTAQTVTVSAGEDDDASSDTATLLHTASGGDYASKTASLTVTTTDDDPVGIVLTPASSLGVDEGDDETYTVKLATQPSATVTVAITGHAGTDLTLDTTSLTFNPSGAEDLWSTAQTVTVSAGEDDDASSDTATLLHTASGGDYASKTASLTVTTTDDDPVGIVLTPASSLGVDEGDDKTYTVKLATQPSATVTVAITGHAGTDLTLDTTSLTFNPSGAEDLWSTAQTVTVSAGEDDDASSDTATLLHTASGGDYASKTASLTVTTTDDDPVGIVLTPASSLGVAEGADATYTVKLATQPSATVTVAITGHAGTDLTLDTTSLTFNPSGAEDLWSTAQTVTVSAGEDDDASSDTATLLHTASGGDYASKTASLTVTTTDDDTVGIVLTPASSLGVAEGADATYTVKLATQPSATVTVAITGHAGTDLTLDTTSLTFNPSGAEDLWSTAQTVTVSAGEDDDASSDTATLLHTASGGDYASKTASLTVTTTDDDKPTVAIGDVPSRINSRTAFTATFTWSEDVTGFATGDVAVSGGMKGAFTATNAKTYTLAVTPNGSADVVVTVAADAATVGGGNTGPAAAVTATATWDTVGIVLTPASSLGVAEGADETYTVKLATQPSATVTVAITGHAGTDLTLDTTSLTFNPSGAEDLWSTAQTVTVSAGEDDDAANDTATLLHTASGGDYASKTASLTVTTTDDDKPTVAIGDVPSRINSRTAFTATFTWSEDVTGFATGDVAVSGGMKGAFTATNAKTYTLAVTPNGSADVVVTVAADAATDVDGNTGPAAAVSATATWDAESTYTPSPGLPLVIVDSITPIGGSCTGRECEITEAPAGSDTLFRLSLVRPALEKGVGLIPVEATEAIAVNAYVQPGVHAYQWLVAPGFAVGESSMVAILRMSPSTLVESDVRRLVMFSGPVGSWGEDNPPPFGVIDNDPYYLTIKDGPDGNAGTITPIVTVWHTHWQKLDGLYEGEAAGFEVMSASAAQVPFEVYLKVEETAGQCVDDALERTHRVSFAPGVPAVAFSVPTVDDSTGEQDCTVKVSLARANGTVPAAGTTTPVLTGGRGGYIIDKTNDARLGGARTHRADATATVRDDESVARKVFFVTGTRQVRESTAGTVNLEVAVEPAPGAPLDLRFSLSGTATQGVDYTVPTVTVPMGATRATIPVTIVDDSHEDSGELVTVRLLASGGYAVLPPRHVSLLILNHDPDSGAPDWTDHRTVVNFLVQVRDNPANAAMKGNAAHIAKWNRVLAAIGHASPEQPMATSEIHANAAKWPDSPFWAASVYLSSLEQGQDQPQQQTPEIAVTGGSAVTEGGDAAFTLTATPAPAADLAVSVTVASDGDWGVAAGTQTVTIPATGSATLTLATTDDATDEPDGSVSVTVADGQGYTVGSSGSGTVAVRDDDDPAPPVAAVDPALVAEVRAMAAQTQHGQAHVERWRRVLVAFGVEEYPGLTPTTAAEAEANAQKYSSPLWPRIADALKKRETALAQQDPDQPPPQEPEITVSAGAAVTEGGEAVFTLTATPAPAADLPVSVNVAAQGDYGITAGPQPVTLPTTGRATLTLATTDDEADEPDGAVTVTVTAGSGYTVGAAASGTVAVRDDDLPPPVVTVSAGASIPEGGTAAFTLTTDRAPAADLAVTLTVAEAADGDFMAAADEGTHTVTILADTTAAAFTVATTDDATVEPDGAVTATVEAGNGYTVGEPASASVTVTDDDAAATAVLSVADATAKEGARLPMMPFIVRLSAPAPGPVQVHVSTRPSTPVSAQPGQDYAPGSYDLTFRVGETEKTVWIWLYDDLHDDGGETFEVVLSHARGATIGDGVAVGTIENADPLPAAFLARFGRTLAQQTLTGLTGRLTAPRTPGLQGTLAGQTFQVEPAEGRAATPTGLLTQVLAGVAQSFGTQPGSFEPIGPLADDPRRGALQGSPRLLTPRQVLLGSRFTLTSQPDAGGGSFGFWGRAAQGYFDGAERGDGTALTLDGSVTTGFLGADYARGPWLLGVALTHSRATGTYAALGGPPPCPLPDQVACDGAVRAGTGDTETTLTAAIPYAALEVSERLQLWGAGGYGAGDVTLKTMGGRYEADTTWAMAAAGLRGALLPPTAGAAGPDLAVTSDAFWTRTASDRTRDLAASASQVTRLRLGLAGSWRMAVGTPPADARSGASLTPKLELGARQDGGDAETGLGVEIGGGVAWVEPALGLSLDLAGRTLLAHENDDLRDRGFSAALAFDPTPATPRGPMLSLRQDVGSPATGGLDALFTAAPLATRTGQAAPSRWGLEAAYGFPVFGGHFTGSPHLGVGLAPRTRDYRLGWRLTPDAASALALSLDLAATRQERDAAAPVHTVGVEVLAQW